MKEILISKFQLLLAIKQSPCSLVVQTRASLLSCLPWPDHHHTCSSSTHLAGSWDGQPYIFSFPEPLRVPLPVGCRLAMVQTVATFEASTTETICTSSSSSCGVLHYTVGPVGDEGGIAHPSETLFDRDCGGTDPSDELNGEDDVLGARYEYLDAHEYLNTDDLPDQTHDNYGSPCDSDSPVDALGNLPDDFPDDLHSELSDDMQDDLADDLLSDLLDDLPDDLPGHLSDDLSDDVTDDVPDDLVSHIDEILQSEDSEKTEVTENMLRQLFERMYDTGCLMPQGDHPSQIYECAILFLVVATVGAVVGQQWIYYALVRPYMDEDEPLIDL